MINFHGPSIGRKAVPVERGLSRRLPKMFASVALVALCLVGGASAEWQELKTAHTPPSRTVAAFAQIKSGTCVTAWLCPAAAACC